VTVKSFDAEKLYADLVWRMSVKGLTWNDVSRETGVGRSAFTRMSKGRAPDVHNALRLLEWLGVSHGLHKYLIMEDEEAR
jgi:transcriptional regulator with XRE-family HTH domain